MSGVERKTNPEDSVSLIDGFDVDSCESAPAPATAPMEISEIIHLNVGGALFSTTIGTLKMDKDSFFASMFSGRFPIAYDSQKRVFIDRDGTHFRHILNYLRQAGKGWAPGKLGLSKAELVQLRDEGQFYMLAPMVKLINDYVFPKKSICVVIIQGNGATSPKAIERLLAEGFTLHTAAAGDGYVTSTLSSDRLPRAACLKQFTEFLKNHEHRQFLVLNFSCGDRVFTMDSQRPNAPGREADA